MSRLSLNPFIYLIVFSCVFQIFVFSENPFVVNDISSSENEITDDFSGDLSENEFINKSVIVAKKYEPTWESLDKRPLPKWYDESKIGIFIHWGVFSVPAFGSEWFWYNWKTDDPATVHYMKENYPLKFTYQDFAPEFTAEFYDPGKWVELFKKAGAKYVVFTSKHHEGYTMWPSKYSFGWNVMDVGPKRDLLGELVTAVRETSDIHFGIYHSLLEWYNPLCMADRWHLFSTDLFVQQKTMPELYEVVNKYKPEVIWSDGDWDALEVYWKSKEFIAWLYNSSPVKDTVVTNDRWGFGVPCKHGGFFTCKDHYNPGVLMPYKWENAMTLDKKSWGYRRDAQVEDFRTPEEIISEVVTTVACGGNILINIGPTKEGTISPVMEERLLQLGQWLEVNGDAIYKSVPWKVAQNDSVTPGVWYTSKPGASKIFAMIVGKWPGKHIQLGSVNQDIVGDIKLLGYEGELSCVKSEVGILVELPDINVVKSRWAWTVVINVME